MKAILITVIAVLLFGCSNNNNINNRISVIDSYSNGQPKNTIYKTLDDKDTYYEIQYDSLGRIYKILPFSNKQMNGTEILIREDLSVAVLRHFKQGKREGFTYEFDRGLQTRFKGEAKDGTFNGISTWFYQNGKLEQTGTRINGENEGEWVNYHENGQIKSKGTYLNGVRQNDWTYWKNDGTVDTTQLKN